VVPNKYRQTTIDYLFAELAQQSEWLFTEDELMQYILLLIIKFYQYFISPWIGKNCRFHPTCSSYAKEAISTHGSFKGLFLSIKRILKCNPLFLGGFDPVPSTEKNDEKKTR
jgi:putative membrane protein insertion efficiency factor